MVCSFHFPFFLFITFSQSWNVNLGQYPDQYPDCSEGTDEDGSMFECGEYGTNYSNWATINLTITWQFLWYKLFLYICKKLLFFIFEKKTVLPGNLVFQNIIWTVYPMALTLNVCPFWFLNASDGSQQRVSRSHFVSVWIDFGWSVKWFTNKSEYNSSQNYYSCPQANCDHCIRRNLKN